MKSILIFTFLLISFSKTFSQDCKSLSLTNFEELIRLRKAEISLYTYLEKKGFVSEKYKELTYFNQCHLGVGSIALNQVRISSMFDFNFNYQTFDPIAYLNLKSEIEKKCQVLKDKNKSYYYRVFGFRKDKFIEAYILNDTIITIFQNLSIEISDHPCWEIHFEINK